MIDSLKRAAALAFLSVWTGCIAYATPIPPDCYTVISPEPYCESEFVWVPGYWSMDWYGRRVWNPGYYTRRMPEVRDHRR